MPIRALQLAGILAVLMFTFAAPAFAASKNVELMKNLPEAKNATAINFLDYKHQGDVMLVTGRFGLKSYSLRDPANPVLLDEITAEDLRLRGDPPVDFRCSGAVHVLAERGHGRRPQAQARPAVARPARVRRVDLTRAGRAGPERRDQHCGRLRDRRQGPAEPPAAELPAAADRTHDHVRQRVQVALDRWSGEHDDAAGHARVDLWAADHRDRPEQPEQAARVPDGPGGPVPAGRRDGLLARRPG